MSHPNPQHERTNEYPEDKVSHYAKRAKNGGPLHNVANRLSSKAKALNKRMDALGGRFRKK
jgi:hypothetical protein